MELLRLRQRKLAAVSRIVVTGADVRPYMLLQHQRVGELFVTDAAGVECADWRFGAVDPHVCLEITLSRERSSTDLTAKRSFSSMCSVVHLQCALAAQRSQTDGALVGIGQLLVDAAHQLFHLARF